MPFAACLGAALLGNATSWLLRLGLATLSLGWALSLGLGGTSLEVLGSSEVGLRQRMTLLSGLDPGAGLSSL